MSDLFDLILEYLDDLYFLIISFIVLYVILMGLFRVYMKNPDNSLCLYLFIIIDIIEFALLYKIYLLII